MSPVREINSLSKLDKEYINKVDGTSTGALLPGEANPTHAQTMEFSSGISSVQALQCIALQCIVSIDTDWIHRYLHKYYVGV